MRMACLILAYSAAPVLRFTIPLYRAEGWEIFVHVDPKVGQNAYIAELGDYAPLCNFVPDPVEVFWGGYSMIEAEIKLIKTAQKAGPFDKYLLLSDDSFPMLPSPWLAQHFNNMDDQVTIERQSKRSPFYVRYQNFFCYDHEATAPRTVQRSEGNTVARPINKRLESKIAEIALLRLQGKKILDIYYGSQFWALTAQSINLILSVLADDLQLQKSFEYSALPDEIMFQSILGNYMHKKRIDTGPVYVDFSTGGPRVIESAEDLPRDVQQPHAFIRKLSPKNTEFLSDMVLRLRTGKTITNIEPGASTVAQLTPGQMGESHLTVRLAAPAENAGSSWHGIESFWGRQYRWTALDCVTWTIHVNLSSPGTVKFILTTVIASRKEWVKECKLALDGKVVPVQILAGELIAEFDHIGQPVLKVTLHTPELKSPSDTVGSHDTRPLGLSVAL